SVKVPVKIWSVRCNSISGASREDEGEGISDGQPVVDKSQCSAAASSPAALAGANGCVEQVTEAVELCSARSEPVRAVGPDCEHDITARTQKSCQTTCGGVFTAGDSRLDEVVCSITEVYRAGIPCDTVSRSTGSKVPGGRAIIECAVGVERVPGAD